jgi:hypothetical protein
MKALRVFEQRLEREFGRPDKEVGAELGPSE